MTWEMRTRTVIRVSKNNSKRITLRVRPIQVSDLILSCALYFILLTESFYRVAIVVKASSRRQRRQILKESPSLIRFQ